MSRKEYEKLKDSIHVSVQENGLVEVRTVMSEKQLDLIQSILFEDSGNSIDDIQLKLFEFGSTVHSTDYIGRRIFICMFHMLQGMKIQRVSQLTNK
ncbi:MAG: hypothetical protein LIO37_01585 [Clostridiales bacterium]|nr:hypothetical protein [Clostridiales bacterium]